jgi:hypothetical protein
MPCSTCGKSAAKKISMPSGRNAANPFKSTKPAQRVNPYGTPKIKSGFKIGR